MLIAELLFLQFLGGFMLAAIKIFIDKNVFPSCYIEDFGRVTTDSLRRGYYAKAGMPSTDLVCNHTYLKQIFPGLCECGKLTTTGYVVSFALNELKPGISGKAYLSKKKSKKESRLWHYRTEGYVIDKTHLTITELADLSELKSTDSRVITAVSAIVHQAPNELAMAAIIKVDLLQKELTRILKNRAVDITAEYGAII